MTVSWGDPIGFDAFSDRKAVAARLETRCRDGMTLETAARRCFDEAVARNRLYGWIALDRNGDGLISAEEAERADRAFRRPR